MGSLQAGASGAGGLTGGMSIAAGQPSMGGGGGSLAMSGGQNGGEAAGGLALAPGGMNMPLPGGAAPGGQNMGGVNVGMGGDVALGCVPGTQLGLCEICGPGGARFAPQRDLACRDQLGCEASRYRTEQVADVPRCIELRSEHDGRCSGIGMCRAEPDSCVYREVVLAVQNECAEVVSCEGVAMPELRLQPVTSPCGNGTDMCTG